MPSTTQVKTSVPTHHPMVAVLGTQDELLRIVQRAFEVDIHVRGNDITVTGPPDQAAEVVHLFGELVKLLDAGQDLDAESVSRTIAMLQDAEHPSPSEVLSDEALTHRGRVIRPKTLGQKRYLDAIRGNTVTFGIGPAGTGKTYLAMAMAVLTLKRKEVNRIILTRPAVEAGERLGYLPGTLFEKIDPYLRPLFDALHDMMDAEHLALNMERGIIEVAPLAYMRGRAQPLSSNVATPTGFRPIGSLRPGDLVIGSDGRPTLVLGVHPQGRKPVFRVRTQDGASTLCCAEHLWAVRTPDDRRRGKPARVLETRAMIGPLRQGHDRRFEIPLVSRPVSFQPRPVPMDPYALGLLLGDGAEVAHPDRTDYVLSRAGGARGDVIVASPVREGLRELVLAGTQPATRFVPDAYLHNSDDVRLAMLQGLLDADGGKVAQRAGASRIRYTTTSSQLRDDVVFLVRSLGGIAHVHHRSDADVIDLRLPAGVRPLCLRRKLDRYLEAGGGPPMRFIDSIEPAGEHETVCIQVAAADSLYVTDDFLVTHNTLNDSFIVLDEAQNTTPEQMKMFLTRLGFGSRVVVTGDVTQVDLPQGRRSGLRVVRTILTGIEGVAFCELTARDVVRHRIVQEIVEAYRVFDERQQPAGERPKGGREA